MKKSCLLIVFVFVLTACNKQMVFEEFITLDDHSWNSSNILRFNVSMTDSVQPYDVLICVRNLGEYEYSNLYLFVTANAPNGNSIRDTVEITLADPRGKWLGKGAASIYTLYYPYRQNIRFPLRGIYTFELEQAMWMKELNNITEIGLRIDKSATKP